MAEVGSAIAHTVAINKLTKKQQHLRLSTKFTGLNLGPTESGSTGVDYYEWSQTLSGTDTVTGCNIDEARTSFFGPGFWKFQHLSDFLSGVTMSNSKSYQSADFLPIPSTFNGQMIISANQRFGAAGDSNSPQSWLVCRRSMSGSVREPDIPEIFYEFDIYLSQSLLSTLISPSVGASASNWFNPFEIKAGMCNNGVGGPDTANAGDWRLILQINPLPYKWQLQAMTRMDDGGNNAAFSVPGVASGSDPKRCLRERYTNLFFLDDWFKVQIYIKRPANNADRTTGRYYCSITPYSTGQEIVLAKWIGGEQMGVQSGPMERFFMGIYSGGNTPYTSTFRNLNIYDGWIRDDDPFTASLSYNDATFYAPMTHSLFQVHGREVIEHTRASVATIVDNEGKLITLPINVPRFKGARYVRNLFTSTAVLPSQDVSIVTNRVYTVSFYGTGTISFSGAYTGSNLVGSGNSVRVQVTFTASNTGNVTCTVTGTCRSAQFEDVTGQSDQTASEYISHGELNGANLWYKHGLCVDGIKAFNTNKDGSLISDLSLKGLVLNTSARTNTALYSRDLTNSVWVKTNMSATLNQVGLDGQANACSRITATANNATILQSITATASAGCLSMYIKRSVGTGLVSITRDNGSTWIDITNQINGTAFTRVSIENTSVLNPTIGIKIANNTDAIIVDCVQNELGGDVSTPIHTTSASATRAAETTKFYESANVKTYTDANSSVGLWLITVEKENWQVENGSVMGNNTTGLFSSNANSGVIAKDSTNIVNGPTGTPTGKKVLGMKYSGSTLNAFADGIWSPSGSYDGDISNSTFIELGKGCTCTIRDVAIWNQVIPSDTDILTLL